MCSGFDGGEGERAAVVLQTELADHQSRCAHQLLGVRREVPWNDAVLAEFDFLDVLDAGYYIVGAVCGHTTRQARNDERARTFSHAFSMSGRSSGWSHLITIHIYNQKICAQMCPHMLDVSTIKNHSRFNIATTTILAQNFLSTQES